MTIKVLSYYFMNKQYSIITNHGVYVALNQCFPTVAPPQTAEQLKNLNTAKNPITP